MPSIVIPSDTFGIIVACIFGAIAVAFYVIME